MVEKLTEKNLGAFINDFYNKYKKNSKQKFLFDLSKYDWISNQNLLLLTSILKYLYKSKAQFEVRLFKDNPTEIKRSQAITLIQLWDVWKIYLIFDRREDPFDKFFIDFKNSTIEFLKSKFGIESTLNIYDRVGVTPFVALDFIKDYSDDLLIQEEIRPIFELNDRIRSELTLEKSSHPFINNIISEIITRELYENYLDHFGHSFFDTDIEMAFMSIALNKKIGREDFFLKKDFLMQEVLPEIADNNKLYHVLIKIITESEFGLITLKSSDFLESLKDVLTKKVFKLIRDKIVKENDQNIQYILKRNITEEEPEEALPFFRNGSEFINQAIVRYTFIDYGVGIPETLKSEYLKEEKAVATNLFEDDNEILKFAFKHYSSRHPIVDKYGHSERFIPRGLFDIVSIAERYKGLLLVRSNFGKVLFNFKDSTSINEAVTEFGNTSEFFPGTYITLYIPELIDEKKFDNSVIRYGSAIKKPKGKPKNIDLFSIISSELIPKETLYNKLLAKLKKELESEPDFSRLNYISFLGVWDRNIINKVMDFLVSDYEINKNNSVIIVHPPSFDIIQGINDRINSLSRIEKEYKIHPVPVIYQQTANDSFNVYWLGIFNNIHQQKLQDLLYENYSLSKSDFDQSDVSVIGNVIFDDEFGNINSYLPTADTLKAYYEGYNANLFKKTIEKFKLKRSDGIYLCNGNYYQSEYLQLSEILIDKTYRDIFSLILFNEIVARTQKQLSKTEQEAKNYLFGSKIEGLSKIKYIAVTSSSHRIVKSFYDQGLVRKKKPREDYTQASYILLDNYLAVEVEEKIGLLEDNTNYILVCDAVSTGNLVRRLDSLISQKVNSKLMFTAVLANTIDPNFVSSKNFLTEFENRLIYLYRAPLEKKSYEQLTSSDFDKKLIRINPFTNLPITFKESSALVDSVIFHKGNKAFLDMIDEEDINIRFKVHNNLIHPYYFDISNIFDKEQDVIKRGETSQSLLNELFKENKIRNLSISDYLVFYPKDSGIDYLDQNSLVSKINKNHTIRFYEIERFSTESGWRFPHSSDYFKQLIKKTPNVLILDDGTCTGNSLLQMINELSYFEPVQIDLLCIISRIDDYRREFLTKLKHLKKQTNPEEGLINLNIYFGSQWNIPVFHPNNNPYAEEIKWLENILDLKNTPQFIKKNALKILETIRPSTDKNEDYRYFPLDKKTGKIPKKEILLARNEIGKIAGYRFYVEDFEWYDKITFNGSLVDYFNPDDNKDLELISICLLYEPYLYENISKSFPDIKHHLEKFVKTIFFGNVQNQHVDITSHLYYDWTKNKKDLIHLFFIVFRENEFQNVLNEHEDIMSKFLKFAGNDEKALDYILYKMSFYFPIGNKARIQSNKEIKSMLQGKLIKYLSSVDPQPFFKERIIRFNHFISTLAYSNEDNSLENMQAKIKDYFNQIGNEDFHDKGINNDKTVLTALFEEIGGKIFSNNDYSADLAQLKQRIRENILPYMAYILSFSQTHSDFFLLQEHFDTLNTSDNSLRGLSHKVENIVFDKKATDYVAGAETITDIYANFFSEKFFLYRIFENIITNDFLKQLFLKIDNFNNQPDRKQRIVFENETGREEVVIDLPRLYTEKILNEIFNNFRHAEEDVIIKINIDNHLLSLDIKTKKSKDIAKGTNNGARLFEKLTKNGTLKTDCVINSRGNLYELTITLKLLS